MNIPNIKESIVYGVFCKDILQMYSTCEDSIYCNFSEDTLKELDIRKMSIDEFRKEFIKSVENNIERSLRKSK